MRLRDEQHRSRRALFVTLWLEEHQFFALLPPAAQWEVHRLYAPSLDLTDDMVLARVSEASKREPSLANRVGKH